MQGTKYNIVNDSISVGVSDSINVLTVEQKNQDNNLAMSFMANTPLNILIAILFLVAILFYFIIRNRDEK